MRRNKLLDFLGVFILGIGFFLAFLPHAVHIAAGLDDKTSHAKHIVYGISLAIIGLIILVYNNDALKLPKRFKSRQ